MPIKSISVSKQVKGPLLSKAQKQFNKLVKQIEKEREKLLAYKDIIPHFQQKYSAEFEPLLENAQKLKGNLIRLLDSAYEEKGYNKTERSKINNYICFMLDELIDSINDYNLKDIYNKHTKGNFDEEVEDEKQALKSMFKTELGLDLDDDFDLNSPAEIMAKLAHQMNEKNEHEEQRHAQKKKSAKAQAKEQKLKDNELEVSRSIKEVYRKLAAQLHPDKEHDLLEQDRKNTLMQRVNIAYENGDLLQLLELQLETEQIDQKMLNSLSADRLNTYIRVFKEQLTTLQEEVRGIQLGFKIRFKFNSEAGIGPLFLMNGLQKEIENMRAHIASITLELNLFNEKKVLKTWLKSYRIRSPFDNFIYW